MCGITGFYSSQGSLNANDYYTAHLTIAHRGPDDEGFFFIDDKKVSGFAAGRDTDVNLGALPNIADQGRLSVVLGHRRLSIIELSVIGHQPMKLGKKILSYNGEIYNYLELKQELESEGVVFNTSTDTEVFLAAYDFWGELAFKKFNGMWAAAIYDEALDEVVLVRDRFGIKPLYYLSDNAGVYFSSEMKFFKKLGLLRNVNEQAIYQYLRFSEVDFSDKNFFDNVYQIKPGSYVTINQSGIKERFFWDENDFLNHEVNKKSAIEVLSDSIKLRLRADVPVGSLLSGGIDSSLIVGCIRDSQELQEVESYSAVFEEDEYSEKKYIEKNSEFLNFKPNYIFPHAEDLIDSIETLVYVQEMPFRSLSVLSQFLIYQEVSKQQKVKVLLNGQGADEIFTGYTEHYSFYFMSLLLKRKIRLLWKEFKAYCRNKNLKYHVALTLVLKNLIAKKKYKSDKYHFFNKPFDRNVEKLNFKGLSPLKQRLYRNLTFSALPEYLRYEDRNSMFFSLESRLPFLDYRLVKFAFNINDIELIKDGMTKVPLREACLGRVDESIINRKDKTGFISPQETWQKTILLKEFDSVFDEIEKYGLFPFINTGSVVSFYKEYKNNLHNDWALVWRIYCLFKWKKVWVCHGDIKSENCSNRP